MRTQVTRLKLCEAAVLLWGARIATLTELFERKLHEVNRHEV